MYKIVFDSNIVWKDKDLDKVFNFYIKEFQDFIMENEIENEVSILVPRIVIKERISQNIRFIEKLINQADEIANKLAPFGVLSPNDVYKKVDYESILEQKALNFLKENDIETIAVPQRSQEEVLERAYKKTKPFSSKEGNDKGYKDTMIWLSVLDNATKNTGANYVICTSNKEDFDSEVLSKEFKECGNEGELTVFSNVQEVKEYLDKNLVLKLDLKVLYKQIEQEIREKIGTIMVAINSYKKVVVSGMSSSAFVSLNEELPLSGYGRFGNDEDMLYAHADMHDFYASNKREKVGYDFKDISILNINKESEDVYAIKTNLEVFPKYKDNTHSYAWGVANPVNSRLSSFVATKTDNMEILSAELSYNRKSGDIQLIYLN